MYHCTIDLLFDWFGISCMTTDNFCFYLQNRLIQTSETGDQWYSDTSPFSIPCSKIPENGRQCKSQCFQATPKMILLKTQTQNVALPISKP